MSKKVKSVLLALGLAAVAAVFLVRSGSRRFPVSVVQCSERRASPVHTGEDDAVYRTVTSKNTASPRPAPYVGPSEKVVILTYMRSGSTLTGDILQQTPEVFYVYEPLFFLSKVLAGHFPRMVEFADNSTYMLPKEEKAMDLERTHFLRAYLDCRLGDVPWQLLSQWTNTKSNVMKSFSKCVINKNYTHASKLNCLDSLVQACLQRRVSAVKTIRASMQEMFSLMESDSRVKVIYLQRDPRAVFRSKSLVGMFQWANVRNASRAACGTMWDDHQMALVLRAHFPGRSLTVRYEDIVAAPVLASKQMYAFLGLRYTQRAERFVRNAMYGGLPDTCNICTTRANATATAYKWRTEARNFPRVLVVQEECGHVMRAFGYRAFATAEEMADARLQAALEDYGPPELTRVRVRDVNRSTTALPATTTNHYGEKDGAMDRKTLPQGG